MMAHPAQLVPYACVAKTKLISALAYRFDVFASLGTNTVLTLASVFLWKTAYRGLGSVGGVEEGMMVTYAIMAIILRALFQCGVHDTISSRMRDGDIAVDMIKPVNLLGYWLAEDLGSAISAVAMHALPLLVASSLLFHIPAPTGAVAFVAFLASSILSYGILWMLAAIVGTIAIWTTELGNLGMVKDAAIGILSGSFVPLWFFPEPFQNISRWLPFQYTYQAPLGIFVGRTPVNEAATILLLQLVWITILWLVLTAVWKRATERILSQGG